MQEPLLLPQYAESLQAQRIQQFQDGMKLVRETWDKVVTAVKYAVGKIASAFTKMLKTLSQFLAYPRKQPRVEKVQVTHFSRQSRYYLAVKHRAALRMQRYVS